MDSKRTYRNWIEDKGLASWTVQLGESDLFIRAQSMLYAQAMKSLCRQRQLIQEYIQGHPEFAATLKPCVIDVAQAPIVQEMTEASWASGVGPMAAVAGAVAQYVGKDLLNYSSEVIVENGGDIFMKTDRARRIGIFAGASSVYTGKLAIQIAPCEQGWGICTSSGTVGHSLSFGKADAVVVLAHSAVRADAWATALGNMVGSPEEVDKTVDFAKNIEDIKGVVVILGRKIGVWGELELKRR